MLVPFLASKNSKCEHHKKQVQEGKNAKNEEKKKKRQPTEYEGSNPI